MENPLAWYIWKSVDESVRLHPELPYYENLHTMILDASAAGADPYQWLADMQAVYNAQPNAVDPVLLIRTLIGNGGVDLVKNFSKATWSTQEPENNASDPYTRVMWSKLGYLAMCVQLCWAAKGAGDIYTYDVFAKTTANWVSSGFQRELMPIIMIESTHDFNIGNDTDGPDYFATLPATLAETYPGTGVTEMLFRKWSDTAYGNLTQALLELTAAHSPAKAGIGALMQGIGGYFDHGVWKPATGDYIPLRNYLRTVGPQSDLNTNYGYFVNWTYYSDGMPGQPPSPPDGRSTMESFTWKLTPAGVHDKA